MAHACDTASRIEEPIDMTAICFKQILSFLIRHPDWNETAKRQHVLSVYKCLGATETIYNGAIKWLKEHN